jgi:hypothetical protein
MDFMKNRHWFCGFLLGILMFSPIVFAFEVTGLFEIELVARSESSEDREQAIKQALFVVLDRILISDDISQIPVVQEMLLGAQHYVKQSQYALLPAEAYGESSARLFRVQFDENQVLEAVRKGQVGIWDEIRPETLLWLVVDADGTRQFYNADTMPDIESALMTASKAKGLPFIYPLLDMEEQQKISVSEVLGTDSKNLLAASSRYEAPAVMAGRLVKKADCWQSEWAFYFDGKIKQWSNGSCQALKFAISAGVRGAYSELSNYYGLKPEIPIVPAVIK